MTFIILKVRRTQQGNNNAYCHDNELSWFDWTLPEKHKTLLRFIKLLLSFRLQRDQAKEKYTMNLKQLLEQATITWHGVILNKPDWSENSHSIALTIGSLSGTTTMHYMINAHSKALEFELPKGNDDSGASWRRWIDTALDSPHDICIPVDAPTLSRENYKVNAYSLVVLLR